MKKILIIRLSSIGDIVLTTPVVRCLKTQSDCEIHYLTKPSNVPILEANPYISKIHVLKEDWSEIIQELKAENFDFIVDLHRNLRSLRIKLSLCKPSSTFKKCNFTKWKIVHLKCFTKHKLHVSHVVERYMETVKPLGITYDGKGLDYFIPEASRLRSTPADTCTVSGVEGQIPSHFLENEYIAIAVGSKHATKQLPVEKLLEICKNTNENFVLLGDNNDKQKAEIIVKSTENNVFNACGILNLNQSAAVVQHAKYLISGDTGLMHIAAALKKPVVSVWGSTVPEFGMYAYFPKGQEHLSKIVQVENLSCRPCSKLGYDECPKKHFNCMNQINTHELKI
ncbi:MAG: glycosyltransferase family 9 protein [Bacteroidales bacterium]|jgi:ADP-heptose:LPS heptosyltransferase|nr:glycosyltransferase family 9 protein [Bacteroidales bacterium]